MDLNQVPLLYHAKPLRFHCKRMHTKYIYISQAIMSQPSRSGPISRVELRVECTGLKKKDEFSKSDPCAVLYMQQRGTNSWSEVYSH